MGKKRKVDKLPRYLYEDVHRFYKQMLKEGMPITKIGAEYNKKENANYAESTLRNKYEEYEKVAITSLREEDLIRRERLADNREKRLDLKNQKLLRREAFYKSEIKKIAETSVVAEICKEVHDSYDPTLNVKGIGIDKVEPSKELPLFLMGDAHAGYMYEGLYDDDVFVYRMEKAFSHIYTKTVENGYQEIYIAEMGDQIEGTGLRKSQLAYTTKSMSKQEIFYREVFTRLLKDLSKKLPKVKINIYFITKDNHSELRVHNTGPGNMDDHMAEAIARGIKETIDTAQEFGGLANVKFTPKDVHIVKAGGVSIYLAHGHQLSKDLTKIPGQLFADLGEVPDIIVTGHWHQFRHLTKQVRDGFMGSIVTTPSMVGDTDFAERLHLSSHPGILLMKVKETHADIEFLELT